MADKEMQVDSHTVSVSNLEKVLFPDDEITKGDLIDYYQRVADTMLPYMEKRPLNMQRFPDGIDEGGFYHKEVPDYFPDWIDRVSVAVREEGSTQPQVVCNKTATLVYLANQACITPHVWLSRVDKLDHPDKLIFDLDPPGGDFEPVRAAALSLRDILEEVGLVPYVMTTGSKGLHVVAPLDRSADFDTVRDFTRNLAQVLARRRPDDLTTETRKNKRHGRLFLDYLRNSYAQTAVVPYAVRARPGAPVATPLDWDELSDSSLHSQTYTMHNIFRRLGQKDDPWRGIMRQARSLKEPRHGLDEISDSS